MHLDDNKKLRDKKRDKDHDNTIPPDIKNRK